MANVNAMAKQLHIINDNGVVSVRKLYDPIRDGRYRAEKSFMRNENGPVLEWLAAKYDFRYVQFTGHAFGQNTLEVVTDWLGKWATKGVRLRTAEISDTNKTGIEWWKFIYGSYTDKGSMISINSKAKVNSLDDMGVHILDPEKAPKYVKRFFAPHQYSVFGEVLSYEENEEGDFTTFQLENGYVGIHRNIRLDKLSKREVAVVDGMHLVSPEFLKQVGVKDRNLNTYAGKADASGPGGFPKGFYHAAEGLKFDIVTYGAKKQLVTDFFYFGILGSLKPGVHFRSDIQSMTNFEEYIFAPGSAQRYFDEIAAAIGDKDRLRGMFLSRLRNLSKVVEFEDNDTVVLVDPEANKAATEKWMLLNAIEAGMDIEAEPSLFRKVVSHFLTEVLNCERGRIPFDHLGLRADITPDPHMFDEYGNIHLENSVIPAGYMVCMDVPVGPVVEYRQPNGMALEHAQSMNIRMRQFEKFLGRRRAFFGPDLLEILEPMNGADMDDTICIIHDPAMVKHIRSLTYPVTYKMAVMEKKRAALGRVYNYLTRSVENLSTASFTPQDFTKAMERARKMTMRLGQVVNNISLDTLLSGAHKENMIKYISHLIQNEEDKDRKIFYLDMREWLVNREDYQLADVATNLEAIIDFCVQGKGNPTQFKDMMDKVRDIMQNTRVYPQIFAKEGTGFQGQGKISPLKRLGVDYILAPSLLDEALNQVETMRFSMQNDLKAHEWNCITDVPEEVDYEYGYSEDIRRFAKQIQKDFNSKVIAAMSISNPKKKRAAYKECLYGSFHVCKVDGPMEERCPENCGNKNKLLQEGLVQWMDAYDEETRIFIAVDLKRICHQDRSMKIDDKTGLVQSVADGVFGNDIVFNYYLKALDACNLTGKYIPIELDQLALSKGVRDQIFDVVVTDGNVIRKSNDFWVGTVDADNGDYRLVNGMLEVRKPDVSITSEANYQSNINDDGEMPHAGEIDIN